jgi:hypothetical protein
LLASGVVASAPRSLPNDGPLRHRKHRRLVRAYFFSRGEMETDFWVYAVLGVGALVTVAGSALLVAAPIVWLF